MDQREKPNGTGPIGKSITASRSNMKEPVTVVRLLPQPSTDDCGRVAGSAPGDGRMIIAPAPKLRSFTVRPAYGNAEQGCSRHLQSGEV